MDWAWCRLLACWAIEQYCLGGGGSAVPRPRRPATSLPHSGDDRLERRRLELQPRPTDVGEMLTELGTGQHVDDEVDRRVEDGHHVADSGVVVVPFAARGTVRLVQNGPEDVVDERWRLADDEHENDDDQNERDVRLVSGCGRHSHLAAPASLTLQRADEVSVENGKRQQRTTQHDDEVEHVGVDYAVDCVSAERAHLERMPRRVETDTHFDLLVLEEPRDVVQ